MGALIEKHGVARFGMRPDSHLICHGAGHHVDRVFLAKQIRDLAFEPFDRRVVAIDVITDWCCRHRVTHRFGRLTTGVAAQVDHGFLHSMNRWSQV